MKPDYTSNNPVEVFEKKKGHNRQKIATVTHFHVQLKLKGKTGVTKCWDIAPNTEQEDTQKQAIREQMEYELRGFKL